MPVTIESRARGRGFSLLEILLALTICGVAMVGCIALLLEGQASHTTALHTERAATLLGDIVEAIEANVTAVDAFRSDNYASGPRQQGCAAAGSCDPRSLAEHQLAEWQQHIAARLPPTGGAVASGSVVAEPTAGAGALRVTIRWGSPAQPAAISATTLIVADAAGAR